MSRLRVRTGVLRTGTTLVTPGRVYLPTERTESGRKDKLYLLLLPRLLGGPIRSVRGHTGRRVSVETGQRDLTPSVSGPEDTDDFRNKGDGSSGFGWASPQS